MSDEHLKLPSQWNDKETEERLEALGNIADSTNRLTNQLSTLRFGDRFPDDLKDYALYLIHDGNRDIGNLRNYVGRGLTDTATWRAMYNCLHWIKHIEVLLELLQARYN